MIGPTCARPSSNSPRCSDGSQSMLQAQRVERGRTDTRTLRSLVEVCDLVEVARDLCHPAPASSRSQKHIAVDLCLGGSREGFALFGHHHPILTVVHTCMLMASGQVPSGPFCDQAARLKPQLQIGRERRETPERRCRSSFSLPRLSGCRFVSTRKSQDPDNSEERLCAA